MPGRWTAELVRSLLRFAGGNKTKIPWIIEEAPIDNLYVKMPGPGITSNC